MNGKVRYLMAGLCALMAGLLTMLYLGGQSSAGGGETEIIWVTAEPVQPGTLLTADHLQRVRVDGPTRQLLAAEALTASTAEGPGRWYATTLIPAGQPLLPGRNIAGQPAPALPPETTADQLRLVTLAIESLPAGPEIAGEDVDIYVVPKPGAEAVRILERTRVMTAAEGLIAVLVPEPQVGLVLTATDGLAVKVVRRLPEVAS
ncbi:MAG: hypothetical protein ACOY93_06175 [Bacillota bacterium]